MKTFLTLPLSLLLTASCTFSTSGSAQNAPPHSNKESKATAIRTDDATITIATVGDMMLGSTSINETFLPPNDGRDALKAVTLILSAADLAFGNLEGPLVDRGTSTKCAPPKPPTPGEERSPSDALLSVFRRDTGNT